MTSGPPFLGELRDRLLHQVLGQLEADPVVDGVVLIGSLGRGEADNWSDIDLLILMGDRALGRFVFERRPIETGTLSFDQLNASGTRQPATAKTADEIRRIHLSYVPVAGKYIGRRSPRASEMIRFLGKMPGFSSCDPAAQAACSSGHRGRPVRSVLVMAK